MKLEKPRKKHYLGQTGIVRSRDDEQSDGWKFFLITVELHAPAVLEDLKQAYDRWNELRQRGGSPVPEYPTHSIREWAIRWNLTRNGEPTDWIVDQVECTFSDWARYPKLVGKSWGTFPGSHEHRPVVPLFEISEALMVLPGNAGEGSPWGRIEQRARSVAAERKRRDSHFTFSMAVDEVLKKDPSLYEEDLDTPSHHTTMVACMPTVYPRRQIRDALQELKANVENVLKQSNFDLQFREYLSTKSPPPPLEKARSIDDEHFVWAVRFQCLGHSRAEIAASIDSNWAEQYQGLNQEKISVGESNRPAVKAGIREVLALVDLTPRRKITGGLPKSSKEKSGL